MDLSIIIPLFNEAESLPPLYDWIKRVMDENKFSYEIIFINDGSTDDSWNVINTLKQKDDCVKAIRFRRNYGKSPALYCGFEKAMGDVVITMDADLQDSPDEIPELFRMIKEDGYDLVSGWKKKRYDNALTKNIPSKIYNATARRVTGIKLHDMNCGLKAYRLDVVKHIEVYGEMHRYIPYLAKNAGFSKIGEKVVVHRKREFGKSKFGLERFVNGYLDLFSLYFLNKFGKQPMHFFGLWGSVMFLIGFVAIIVVGAMKIYYLSHHMPAPLVTDTPYFYIALTMMLLGTQMFLSGFVGELVSRSNVDRNKYQIAEEI
ncbi:MAG: glycosyltransferase [Bacteroidales bacterium]|nr:glycosyltransferase family 2 protein [Bacteroidales bacterium]MDD5975405.1 glycosyltransferase [Bacteroidales bacterium]MDY5194319.1 glycosyltransferase [Candidatus Aphodosoma sp.]